MTSSRIWGIIEAEACVICRRRRLRQITQIEALIIPDILREPNSIIVLLFIYIYIGLRVNACTVNENLSFEEALVFSRFRQRQQKLVWRHNVMYVFPIYDQITS